MPTVDPELALKLSLSCRILANEGLSDLVFGHVGARRPGEEFFHMKPRGLGLEEIRPEDIIILDFEGRKLAGDKPNHSEYPIHVEIFKARPDVNCVVHVHPRYATALGATGGQMHAVSHEGVLFTDLPLFQDTTALIRSSEAARGVARSLGDSRAVLLRNHGVVVVGATVEEATVISVILERAAQQEVLTRQFGDFTCTPDEENSLKVEQIYRQKNITELWDYFGRRLKSD